MESSRRTIKPQHSIHELSDLSPSPPPPSSTMSANRSSSSRSSQRSHAFSPPPPITASIYRPALSSRLDQNAPVRRDPDIVLALRREEKALQEELQELLDAQSEGLFQVTGGGGGEVAGDIASSTGTSTPTLASELRREQDIERDASPAERNQRRKKKPGLRGARRGIYRAIQKLAAVKVEEGSLAVTKLQVTESNLTQIQHYESKRAKLEQRIQSIENAGSRQRAQDIQSEAQRLEVEIQKLEDKLLDMKARHRHLLEEAAATESSVQAKLSSYKAALSLLESDIQTFLVRPPKASSTTGATSGSEFLRLPGNRRTLGLAREHWTEEQRSLEQEPQDLSNEHQALEEGAQVWKDVIHLVDDFEAQLSNFLLQQSATTRSMTLHPASKGKEKASDDSTTTDGPPNDANASILAKMDDVTDRLEYYVALAESKNWKLLVCCIGAELEAFKQGTEVLREPISGGGGVSPDDAPQQRWPRDADAERDAIDDSEKDAGDGKDNGVFTPPTWVDTNDEPDPTLLLEKKDSTDYDTDPEVAIWR